MALACLCSRAARLTGEPLDWVTFILFEERKTSNGFDPVAKKSVTKLDYSGMDEMLNLKSVCNLLDTDVQNVA
jgi:hypothetical protein